MEDFDQKKLIKSQVEESFGGRYSLGMKSLMKSLAAAFYIMLLIILGMVVWFFTFGGYYQVEPQEAVVVLTFGRYDGYNVEGAHWVFPKPVNSLVRLPYKKTLTISSTAFLPMKDTSGMFQGEGMEDMGRPLEPGKDGYVISGDENIMHVNWSLNYSVVEPDRYYMTCLTPADPKEKDEILTDPETGGKIGSRGPMTLIEQTMNSSVIEAAARMEVDVLYKSQTEFSTAVLNRLNRKITELGIGIAIDNIQITCNVPQKTKSAFDMVLEAEQEASKTKQLAKTEAVKIKNSAESDKVKIIAEAETYKIRTIADVVADARNFENIYSKYKAYPESTLLNIYNDALWEALSPVKDKFILRTIKGGRQQLRLKLNPEPELKKE